MSFFLCGVVRRRGALRRIAPLAVAAASLFGSLFAALAAFASPAAAVDPGIATPPPVYRPAFGGPMGVERGRTPWRDANAAALQEAGRAHGAHENHAAPLPPSAAPAPLPSDAPAADPHDHSHHQPAGSGR